jgi:glutathione S-transferase
VSDLILHQYELSPFSEKIRRILAFKKLPWTAVRAPAVMPKPDVVALTGGYRKIPILQIGNHVYCDTSLIARVIEQRAPEPTLYPTPMAHALAEWFDNVVFENVAPMVARPTRFDEAMRLLTQDELVKMGEDRAAMRDPTRRKLPGYKVARAQLDVYLSRIEETARKSAFLLGASPCIVDFSAYHSAWLLEKIAPEPLAPYAGVRAWMERVAAITGPEPTALSSDAALGVCRAGSATWAAPEPFVEVAGATQGQSITVRANDYGCDPVEGTLVHSALSEVVLRREDPRAGVVFLHFPRIGYELTVG